MEGLLGDTDDGDAAGERLIQPGAETGPGVAVEVDVAVDDQDLQL